MEIKVKVDLELLRKYVPSAELPCSKYVNLDLLRKYVPSEELCLILENFIISRGKPYRKYTNGVIKTLIQVKIDLDILKKYIPSGELCPILENFIISRGKRAKYANEWWWKNKKREVNNANY